MIQHYEEGPFHEAFVTKIAGELILEAVDQQPPEPINERIPRQLDLQAEWIPGYWSWEKQLADFIWVSGVWRRPPPGHTWISGFWKQYEEGWVWVPGYWSRVPLQNTAYIGIPPPDSIDENMAPPRSNNYFWVQGYWHFLFNQQGYQWIPGYWEELDPYWVFVPAHYIWRPGGYVFIPAYWDWSLEERGTAYSAVIIDPAYRYQVIYEPLLVLKPATLLRRIFLYYPDYLYFIHHHYYYHPDFWNQFCCSPPWWSWDTWWGLTWHDQWALWWWYTHPGYPQPVWITADLSSMLPPPLPDFFALVDRMPPPPFVTPQGVATRGEVLQALNKTTGSFSPILPSDARARRRINTLARPSSLDKKYILKPSGRRLPIDPKAVRPNVRKPSINPQAASQARLMREDLRPRIPLKPRIPTTRGGPIWRTESRETPIYITPERRPTWTPRTSIPPVHVVPGQERLEREAPWRPRPSWGEPPIRRPSIYLPSERKSDQVPVQVLPSREERGGRRQLPIQIPNREEGGGGQRGVPVGKPPERVQSLPSSSEGKKKSKEDKDEEDEQPGEGKGRKK